MTETLIITEPGEFDYWCNNCGQLRRFCGLDKFVSCGNCGSDDVIKAPVGTLDKDWLRQQWMAKSKEAK